MGKKFEKQQKIKFNHCDLAGIVFYPRFFEMLNELVEDWFEEELNYSFLIMHPENGVPTVDINIQFKSVARLGDVLIKRLWVEELSDRSLKYRFEFMNDSKITLKGTAVLVNVALNKKTETIKPEKWKLEVKEKIELYLK